MTTLFVPASFSRIASIVSIRPRISGTPSARASSLMMQFSEPVVGVAVMNTVLCG
jgi:hypothetical protein